ncbi:MAG TPA: hypothetical protein VFH97_08225 [Gemmatimonadales bacterium]|nr:hypothetical protein [Gemmatimonadales bacterium]
MRIPCWGAARLRAAALVVVACAAACGDEPAPADPGPPEHVYETANFTIVDQSELSAEQVDTLGARLELELVRVGQVLPDLPRPPRITVYVLAGAGIPFVTAAENSLSQWRASLDLDYLPHQLTHLHTGYPRRPFLEEGLAVYVSELVLPGVAVNPYRGQPPHAWMTLFESNGSTISLFTAYRADNLGYAYNGSTADASAWQLFIEAGSFTRWVVETYGWAEWWQLYQLDNLFEALGGTTPELEAAWLAAALAAYPAPLACEDALGTVGPREEFWCARARGEVNVQ